jgi:FtsZ-binding cell division protein ZapB
MNKQDEQKISQIVDAIKQLRIDTAELKSKIQTTDDGLIECQKEVAKYNLKIAAYIAGVKDGFRFKKLKE